MQIQSDFMFSEMDFKISSVKRHPSGAFAITLQNGYAIIGIQTSIGLRVSRCIMSATGRNDTRDFYDIGDGGVLLSPKDNPKYKTSLGNQEQSTFLDECTSRLRDPITQLQNRSMRLHEEILGEIELEPVTSRHIQRTASLVNQALRDYISNIFHPIGSTVVDSAGSRLRKMIKTGKFLKATPVGLRVVNREILKYKNPKDGIENGSNFLQISSQEDPQKWNPEKFGNRSSLGDPHGCLRGNLDGIILPPSGIIDYPVDKNSGIILYSRGGYYMEISPEHAESIRVSPELVRVADGKRGNMERKLSQYIPRILVESGLMG